MQQNIQKMHCQGTRGGSHYNHGELQIKGKYGKLVLRKYNFQERLVVTTRHAKSNRKGINKKGEQNFYFELCLN